MIVIRGSVGFVMFLIAFALKQQDAGTAMFGVALSLAALGTSSATPRRRGSDATPARRRC